MNFYGFKYIAGPSLNVVFDLTTDFAISLKMEYYSLWHIDFHSPSDVIDQSEYSFFGVDAAY